jgi:hypothetical protein
VIITLYDDQGSNAIFSYIIPNLKNHLLYNILGSACLPFVLLVMKGINVLLKITTQTHMVFLIMGQNFQGFKIRCTNRRCIFTNI